MPSYAQIAAFAVATAPALVSAHGYISGVVSGGKWYSGTSPGWIYQSTKPNTAGWYANNQDNGFVEPSSYSSGDIICHKGATPGLGSIPVAAGSSVDLQWSTWPDSHHGPTMTYLAAVDGEFADINKADLGWFKIQADGLVDGSSAPGVWATDEMLANNLTSTVTIPSNIPAGNYVLRNEIIALHGAGSQGGAQNYPQCLNIVVEGGSSGAAAPEGVVGTKLYTPSEPGIVFNIYQSMDSYPIPGPALSSGAKSAAKSAAKYSSKAQRRHARNFRA